MFYNSITDILLVTEAVYDHLCFTASENNLILASAELDCGNYSVLFMLKIYLFSCMYTEFSGWDIAILSKQQDIPEGSKWCVIKKKKDTAFPRNITCGKFRQGLTQPRPSEPSELQAANPICASA